MRRTQVLYDNANGVGSFAGLDDQQTVLVDRVFNANKTINVALFSYVNAGDWEWAPDCLRSQATAHAGSSLGARLSAEATSWTLIEGGHVGLKGIAIGALISLIPSVGLLAASSPPATANWVKVRTEPAGATYIDANSILVRGKFREVWAKTVTNVTDPRRVSVGSLVGGMIARDDGTCCSILRAILRTGSY